MEGTRVLYVGIGHTLLGAGSSYGYLWAGFFVIP